MELRAGQYPEPDERPALFDGNWGPYILDNYKSVEEVIQSGASVTVRDQGYTSHYLLADADGNCVAIEYLDGQFIYYTGKDLPVKALSNMRYELTVSEQDAKDLTMFFEGFECGR